MSAAVEGTAEDQNSRRHMLYEPAGYRHVVHSHLCTHTQPLAFTMLISFLAAASLVTV